MGKIIVMSKFLLLLCFVFFFFGCSDQLLLSSSSSFTNSSTKLCPHGQALALLQFKQSFSIDKYSSSYSGCDEDGSTTSYPKTENWKEEEGSEDCCSWDGVTCDLVTGHVIEIDLSCSWLSGTIHPNSTLFLFSHHLQSLNLAFNNFSGSFVSAGFGRFSSLMHLNLSYSGFSGLISPEISHLSNLVSLDFSWNDGTGFAPHGFHSLVQNLTKLQKLHLAGISISSVFHNSLLNRSFLISLDLSYTELHGRFPDHHDIHLPKLQLLSLWENYDLSGNFPRFNENNSLIHLDLSSTNFSGELPASMGNLKSLQTLDLSDCQFSGSIPASLGNLKSLQTLYLSFCHFSGSIPASLQNLTQITSLKLNNNHFSGKIPASIGNLTNLVILDLSHNRLEGAIPSTVNVFSSLSYLGLSYNLLNGTIPSWLYALPSLLGLSLSHNKFTGRISEFKSDSLEDIDLSMNELHGSIPSSIFEFVNLTYLHLSSNNLSGILETSKFEKLRKLTDLDISNNMLSLTMSDHSNSILPNIQSIDLSNNNISGIFSWIVGKDTLRYLNLSYNSISGFEMLPWKIMEILDLHSNLLQGLLPTPPNSTFFFSVSHNKLSGEISPLICKASSLGILDLSHNIFGGILPHCLGNFSKDLFVLNLRRNQFHGTIPQRFLKRNSIRTLDFNGNQFEGLVPRSLIICRELEVLDLGNNMINDTFPHWLGALPKLQVLVLHSNRFHGHIGFSKIKSPFMSLRIFDLAHNDFEGDLSKMYLRSLNAIMNIDEGNMTREYMGNDYYQDSITMTIKGLEMLPCIEKIDLSNNNISGIWTWNVGKDTLKRLNLSYNSISGFEMFPWESMQILDLRSNLLQGPLPTPPKSTSFFSVSRNKLSGEISPLICRVSSMEILDLSYNNLSGMLPHCLGNFSEALFVLNLRKNQFHGTIPQTFVKGNSIRSLDFNGNQLEGLVPRSLIICTELEVLDLGNNKINDTFPHWLGALPKLQVLVFRSNHFHGHIGFWKIKSPFMSLRIIDLACNDFEGELPEMYLRSLKAIMNIDEGSMTREYMGNHYYQDSITMTIKGTEIDFVKILNTFTTIDLSSNKFQGGILECIGNLNSLRGLNLSDNNLTGHIPSSFRNLKMLESLDLSSNGLSGRIPEDLTSLTFLEVLNVSQNHLTGLIPQGKQFSTFGNDSYYGNSGLCGFPLSKRCISIDETPGLSKKQDAEFGNKFDWKFMLMGYGCGLVFGLSLGGLIFLIGKPRWLVTMVEDHILKKIIRPKRSAYRRRSRRN